MFIIFTYCNTFMYLNWIYNLKISLFKLNSGVRQIIFKCSACTVNEQSQADVFFQSRVSLKHESTSREKGIRILNEFIQISQPKVLKMSHMMVIAFSPRWSNCWSKLTFNHPHPCLSCDGVLDENFSFNSTLWRSIILLWVVNSKVILCVYEIQIYLMTWKQHIMA